MREYPHPALRPADGEPRTPLRILMVAPCWVSVPPKAYGGTELVIDVLARGLAARGHEVTLATTGDSTCEVPKVAYHPQALGTDRATPLAETIHVMEAYRDSEGFDIVHDHTVVGPLVGPSFTAAPIVTTNHGPFIDDLAEYYRRIQDTTPIIAISHDQARRAHGIQVATVIHHGIEMDKVPLGQGDGGYVAFLGRMHPDKGVDRAIRIARQAGVRLVIAAKMREPVEHRFFEEVIRPMLGSGIEYVGEVGPEGKQELLAHAIALLNPIAWPEPFGLVMIEAMAHGTPVVATRFGSAPEIVIPGATGVLGDTDEELAAGIAEAAALERKQVRMEAEQRFDASRMVEDHERFYRRVIARHATIPAAGIGA
jgi:glycosyltransferase involved in cell wall biosynthesis